MVRIISAASVGDGFYDQSLDGISFCDDSHNEDRVVERPRRKTRRGRKVLQLAAESIVTPTERLDIGETLEQVDLL